MYEWNAIYKTSSSDTGSEALVETDRTNLLIRLESAVDGAPVEWPLKDIDVRHNELMDITFVRAYPGALAALVIPGKEVARQLESLTGRSQHTQLPAAPRHWRSRILLVFLLVIGCIVGAWLLLVPWLAGKIASGVDPDTEAGFGESIFSGLNLGPETDSAKTFLANRFFAEMNVATPYNVRITVVNSPIKNAFALPGGRIVLYTGLLNKLKDYPEFAALVSHEYSHVQLKHATRSVFRSIGSKVFLSLVLGNNGAIGSVLADQAEQLKSLGYSRSLEKEADLHGLQLLRARQIDPAGFTGLFNQLKKDDGQGEMPEILASHPNLDERIRYVSEAAGNPEIRTDSTLQQIFVQLKN
ncbi:MAG: hypothetical protein EOO09_08715 [Chitinophagaceae bacterium]|nr:MAG: hypothetical protein EOO09_08715 [Chitinophagaceae bacterium]